jgi:hypothetical protein
MKLNFTFIAIALFSFFLFSCNCKCKKNQTSKSEKTQSNETVKVAKVDQKVELKKEFTFTDEKGSVLFNGKKIKLDAGQIELEKDVVFQLVTDDNGRWKIELTSKDYMIAESNSFIEENNLYPINEESLKNLNTLILTKIKP